MQIRKMDQQMKSDKLVTMANQIGTFFESYPDREEAKQEIANHLQRFWAPRMRAELLGQLELQQGLSELVMAALVAHRGRLMPLRT
jgi:formate dehydrogenase subunit delta